MSRRLPTVAALATLLAAGSASAFVRSRTDQGTAVFWPQSQAWIIPDTDPGFDLTLDVVTATLTKSVANWQDAANNSSCSYFKINVDPAMPGDAHLDHVNFLKFRTDKWCRPAEKSNDEMCFSDQAAAITTIFYTSKPGDPRDGVIVDADIEMNNINFTFITVPSTVPARAGTTTTDLENTLTHELGHFQGLDHTCYDHVTATHPVDDQNMPIPECNDVLDHAVPLLVYDKVFFATMFNFAGSTETYKRSPTADDIAGICAIYPFANDPMIFSRPEPLHGCSTTALGARGQSDGTLPVSLALLSLLALSLVRARACSRSRRR